MICLARIPARFAVFRGRDLKAGFAQTLGEVSRSLLFIFDQQNSHLREIDQMIPIMSQSSESMHCFFFAAA